MQSNKGDLFMKKTHITIPKEMSPELAELIGIIMGDGYLYNGINKYTIGIVGHPITDLNYFKHIAILIKKLFNKKVKIKKIGRGIRIIFDSKNIFKLITKYVPYYKGGKSDKIIIPKDILTSWSLAKHTIRGIADTDGSIFTANKPGCSNYPSIEITTSSIKLAYQIRDILNNNEFRVANIWSYKSKNSIKTSYKVPLNGKNNLKLWMEEIGFSNPHKKEKALKVLKKMGSMGFEPMTPR